MRPELRRALDRALEGHEPSAEEGLLLATARGDELWALARAADEMRRRQVGEVVTYVVNRNINFTNVCIKRCSFCAFSRDYRQEEGYFLPTEEILRRVEEAVALGATEVCLQAGLAPKLEGRFYIELTAAIKERFPRLHLHAWSPEEVLYGALRLGTSIRDYLKELLAAGLDSLPGTSAEILDPEVRDRIAPGRIRVEQWTEVITTAHELGLPTTATIMYGHVEEPRHWVSHLQHLRDIQKGTGGFTEFVPLSLVHQEAPMHRQGLVPGARRGPSGAEVVCMHALARLFLGPHIPNIQASWVKEGPRLAQILLDCGANDLGGTLINESISTSAGASFGQLLPPAELRRLIRDAGRTPAQRDTRYRLLKVYGPEDEEVGELDRVTDADERFGSYRGLVASGRHRFVHPKERATRGGASG